MKSKKPFRNDQDVPRRELPQVDPSLSPFKQHKQRWSSGCGSEECQGARKICLARGKVPCDVLFIGEAPGESENVIGAPFIGPAGKQLDDQIEEAAEGVLVDCGRDRDPRPLRFAFTNLVCCIPRDGGTKKASQPSQEQVFCCSDRLKEFVSICKPKLIVCVGASARDYLDRRYSRSIRFDGDTMITDITHPSAILQAKTAQQSLMIRRNVVSLANAFEEIAVS